MPLTKVVRLRASGEVFFGEPFVKRSGDETVGNQVNTYIISYDISANKARNKLVKILEGYGKRFQYSVFICGLTKEIADELRDKIVEFMLWKQKREARHFEEAMRSVNDSIAVFLLCGQCVSKIRFFGRETDTGKSHVVI